LFKGLPPDDKLAAIVMAQTPQDTLVYVGTFTGNRGKGKGIYLFRFQRDNLTLVPLGSAVETSNPSFLEVDLKRRVIFSVNADTTGGVSAFSIDPASGKLKLINQQPSRGDGPCHLVLDGTGRNLLVANYNSGSVTVLPVAADGRLGAPSEFIQHTGKSAHPERQQGPHAHCVTMSPDNRLAYVCDLGLDKVAIYNFDSDEGKLRPHHPAFISVKPGSGPRHMVFRPDGKFAYVNHEINSTVSAFSYDSASGALTEIQNLSTLPRGYHGPNSGAEIGVHPSGKWLYASNRGNDTVVLYNIDAPTGALTYVAEQNTGGKTPRHFGWDRSATHMILSNEDSDSLQACQIDPGSGRVKPSGIFAACPSPVCAKFVPAS
jgi:6-phosphogluconolactonase